jgi:MFS family permease
MGFTMAVVATSVGSIAGPVLAGALADMRGTGAALLAGAALSAVAALLAPFLRRAAARAPSATRRASRGGSCPVATFAAPILSGEQTGRPDAFDARTVGHGNRVRRGHAGIGPASPGHRKRRGT